MLKYEQEKLQEKSDRLKSDNNIRKSKKLNSISIPQQFIDDGTVIGQVVDIGYVDGDPRVAEIMSWAASPYMHALVVSNSSALRRESYFRDRSVVLWEVERIVPYRNFQGRLRSQNDCSQNIIPFALPWLNEPVSGNPRYMVCRIPFSA